MSGREPPRGPDPDPDDWFAEPRPARPPGGEQATPEAAADPDDWLETAPARRPRRRRRRGFVWNRRTGTAVAVLGVVLLLVGLAAGGVFSGSSSPSSAPNPNTRPATTGAATTRTATTRATTTRATTTRATTTGRTTTSRTAPPPTATLKPGDSGSNVRALQRELAALGYSPGAIDGSYGPSTKAAVEQFQRASGLTADGVAGQETLAALGQALPATG
jgi:Putative peptidoglycan binding domain